MVHLLFLRHQSDISPEGLLGTRLSFLSSYCWGRGTTLATSTDPSPSPRLLCVLLFLLIIPCFINFLSLIKPVRTTNHKPQGWRHKVSQMCPGVLGSRFGSTSNSIRSGSRDTGWFHRAWRAVTQPATPGRGQLPNFSGSPKIPMPQVS